MQHVGVAHEIQRVRRVRLVRQRISADHRKVVVTPDFGELLVDDLGTLVDVDRLFVLTDTQIDVAGHMHHVARNRHNVFQLMGRRHGQFRFAGSFHQMDIQMICTGMVVFNRHGAASNAARASAVPPLGEPSGSQ